MKTVLLAGLLTMFPLPWFGGPHGTHPPKPVSVFDRRLMEDWVHDHPDFPLHYAGRPFSTIGNAYRAPLERNPLGFTETRTLGADVFCSNVVGPIFYGEQIRVTGVLQAPVFTWDEGSKTFFMKDCVLSR
jgi:hypothetical protein